MSNPTHNITQKSVPTKNKQKFVPKFQNPNPTLTTSLRQSKPTSSASSSSSSRVQLGENGEWVSGQNGNFVKYLPQDEAVAAGLGADEGGLDPVESQRVVDVLNRQLSRLLKLGPREFWRQVASDKSLHEFLDSFLQFRSRWYDFPYHGAKGIVAGVIVGEYDLSRRVFMVLYRISSNKDPGARPADSLSPNDHGVLLQEKKLLDLPKLLDICAIYGHENEDLTRLLVGNALRAQPWIHDNFIPVLAHFLSIINTMQQRCSTSLEVLIGSGSDGNHGSSRLHSDLLEVMDFINDAIVAMDAFVTAYKPAAVFFSCPVETSNGNEELLSTLAKLHDSLLQTLRQGFQSIRDVWEDEMITNVAISLKMLSTRLANFGWKLLEICYLSGEVFEEKFILPVITKMFPAKVEDPSIRADILVQTFREISELSLHIQMNQSTETYIQSIEKQFNLISRLENLCDSGWIVLDAEQFQYLSGITAHSPKEIIKKSSRQPDIEIDNKADIEEDSGILESKISQIKDIFPDYGNSFLAACLEVYNQNPEEVIQRILEGTLHEDLLSLDISLEYMPPRRASSTNKNDKGKGKLVETSLPHTSNKVGVALDQQVSSASSSSTGRYVRKTNDDLNEPVVLNVRDKKDSAVTAALISQYEYEDEYDDSFDDLNVNVVGSGLDEDETYGEKIRPNMGMETESGSSGQNPSNSKWGSRKKPQFYVKDGKNYSYKVDGAVAVANANEASLVNQTQKELIHGLGRGGNVPLGAVKKLTDYQTEQDKQPDTVEIGSRGNMINPRGRGRRGGGRMGGSYGDDQSGVPEAEGTGNVGYQRGRGRRGGGRNHNRKDRAINKHVSSLNRY